MKKLLVCVILFLFMQPLALAAKPNPISVLSESEIPQTPEGIYHYLLLCIDSWDSSINNLGNTDGTVLLTIDTETHRVMLTSFSRDLLIMRPDNIIGRLTYVCKNFGPEKFLYTLNRNFGLRISKYVILDWTGVKNIIDAAGGVDISITAGEAIRLKDKLTYKSDWTTPVLVGAGTYHFKGYSAVIYMRIRSDRRVNGVAQDLVRTSRTRAVLSSIANNLSNVSFSDAENLVNKACANVVATNMSMSDVTEALSLAFTLQGVHIEQMSIPMDGTEQEIEYVGMQVYQTDYVLNRNALHEFLFYSSFLVDDDVK